MSFLTSLTTSCTYFLLRHANSRAPLVNYPTRGRLVSLLTEARRHLPQLADARLPLQPCSGPFRRLRLWALLEERSAVVAVHFWGQTVVKLNWVLLAALLGSGAFTARTYLG